MSERGAISKRIRFEVFKRDSFTCQYCGQRPPVVVLEIDHITPVSEGGVDTIDNLVSACFDCNRGKGPKALSNIPPSVEERARILQEKREQLQALNEQIEADQAQFDAEISLIEKALWPEMGWVMLPKARASMRLILQRLPVAQIVEFARLSVGRTPTPDRDFNYMCGCCWRVINNDDRGGRFKR